MISKIHKKGAAWSHHGKKKGRFCLCVSEDRRKHQIKRLRERTNAIVEMVIEDRRRLMVGL